MVPEGLLLFGLIPPGPPLSVVSGDRPEPSNIGRVVGNNNHFESGVVYEGTGGNKVESEAKTSTANHGPSHASRHSVEALVTDIASARPTRQW